MANKPQHKKEKSELEALAQAGELSADQSAKDVHELLVHQTELEAQNEELRQMQHQLELVRDQFTDIFDYAPIGYCILDRNGIVKKINLTACGILGIERSRIKEKPFSSYMAEKEDKEMFFKCIREVFEMDGVRSSEFQLKRKDGKVFPAQFSCTAHMDIEDNETYCRIALTDLTGEKKTKELLDLNKALAREKENAQNYLDLAPVIFLFTDNQHKVQMINKTGCKLLGYDEAEILGKNWFKFFVPKEERGEVIKNFVRIREEDIHENAYYECHVKSKTQGLRFISWTNSEITDDKGNELGILSAGSDITSRKNAETIMLNYTGELEKTVKERTAELRQSLEQEKQMHEMKRTFVSMASHEFRTPLTSILSSTSLIARYKETDQLEKQDRHIERIEAAVKTLTEILDEFLSLDKLEQGRVKPKFELLKLKSFTENIVDELDPMTKKGQQIIYSHLSDSNQEIPLDKNILRNIYYNLISNAIKYSETDIEVQTEVKDQNVNIIVTDHGVGIPEEAKPFMFTRFYRAGNVVNTQGTGLGLTIVKHFVELLGGNVGFSSNLRIGTKFTVQFPQPPYDGNNSTN